MEIKKKHILNIGYHEGAESPREWCNIGTLWFPSDSPWKHLSESELTCPADIVSNTKMYYLPIYAYSHGGIALSSSPFTCKFDSSLRGFIYVDHAKVEEESLDKERILEFLQNEIKTFGQWLNGEVYEFTVTCISTIELDGKEYQHEEVIDSCCGMYNIADIIYNVPDVQIDEFSGEFQNEARVEYNSRSINNINQESKSK